MREGPNSRGLLAITATSDAASHRDLLDAVGHPSPVDLVSSRSVTAVSWDVPVPRPGTSEAAPLCTVARLHEAEQSTAQVHELLSTPSAGLGQLLPTFAAVTWTGDDELRAAADVLGFRHLYEVSGVDWAGLATSVHVLSTHLGSSLDDEALAVQSQLGWQLGQRTLFAGVGKVAPGTVVTLSAGRMHRATTSPAPSEPQLPTDQAVTAVARLLRSYLNAYLDDHPDAILQLSGGVDSRVVLSAVPPARRKGLHAMTLGVPGSPDLDIATDLTQRFGMRHEVITLDRLDDIDAKQAYERCVAAAVELDCTADPLAHAALAGAEEHAEPGPRLSGLGGEVARGFYYLGRTRNPAVTSQWAGRLARWRMFANDGVQSGALAADFGSWAREFAVKEVEQALVGTGKAWLAATDDLYLTHRMQRWGGITETAVCLDRPVVSPMLDDRFLALVDRVHPADKHNAHFLCRVLEELDPNLALVPLDGRPTPAAYAHRAARSSAQVLGSNLTKLYHKGVQRIRHVNRPPIGGDVLSGKVVEHWRANPTLLEPLHGQGIFDTYWLEAMIEGKVSPMSSTVAFLLNVLVARSTGAARPAG